MIKYLLLLMIGASDVIIPLLSFEVYCVEKPKTNRWILLFLLAAAIILRCFTRLNFLILNSAIFLLLALLTYRKKMNMRIIMAWIIFSGFLFVSITALNQMFYFNSMFNYLSALEMNTSDFLLERNEFMCKMIYMLFVILILTEREYKSSFDQKYWNKMRLFLIFGMVIIFILGLFATRARDQRQVVLYAFMAGLLFYLVYLLYLFFKDLVETISSKQRVESQNKMSEMKLQQLMEREDSYEQIKRFKHDMKNNMNVLSYLLQEGKIENAKSYLEKYLHSYAKADHVIPVENDIIAAILHDKMTRYPKLQFHIEYRAPKKIGLSDVDICTLIGNLLDNACEYLDGKDEKGSVDIIIQQYYEKIFIEVSNDYFEQDIQLKTTKQEKEYHGYGLTNVRHVVESCDGVMDIHVEQRRFIVRILMEPGGETLDHDTKKK